MSIDSMTNKDLQKLFETKYKSKIASTRGRLDKDGNSIEVRLTLEEFTMLYKDAGVLPIAPYVISRKNDKGHYEIGNVFISTNVQNSLEAHGMCSEQDIILTNYCYTYKYKRRVVKQALKSGKLQWRDVMEMKPIVLEK